MLEFFGVLLLTFLLSLALFVVCEFPAARLDKALFSVCTPKSGSSSSRKGKLELGNDPVIPVDKCAVTVSDVPLENGNGSHASPEH